MPIKHLWGDNIKLTPEEKIDLLSMVKTWDRPQHSQQALIEIQRKTGIPARLAEITFWHYDTLFVLSGADWLVFKGGTCVQTYLEPGFQRASADLDFNSSLENPNTILHEMDAINRSIDKNKASFRTGKIDFGRIEFICEDKATGTMNFIRRMPSRFGETELVDGSRIQARSLRIQINRKHAWLPSIKPVTKAPRFFITQFQRPREVFDLVHSSKEDLLADKILATCNAHGFRRERFKDVYDMGLLLRLDLESELVCKKLDMIAQESETERKQFLNGSARTVINFSEKTAQARGFLCMVAREGRELAWDWEGFCHNIVRSLKLIFQE